MATTTTKQTNLSTALGALISELGAPVAKEDLAAYVAQLNAVVDAVQAVRAPHNKAIRGLASAASKAKRDVRVAKALALLDAQEAAEGAAATK